MTVNAGYLTSNPLSMLLDLRYSDGPNMKGYININEAYFTSGSGSLVELEGYYTSRSGNLQGADNRNLLEFDPSKVSALYKDNLNEVRVNAIYGLNLVRAF